MNKKVAARVVIGILSLAAGAVSCRREEPHADHLIRVSGNIEATTVPLSFRIPGKLRKRYVDEGDPVTAGQKVAELETDDLDQDVAQREAEAAAAAAGLAEMKAGSRPEEIRRGAAALERASAEAERLDADLVRMRNLFRKEVVTKQQLDAAETAAASARGAAREAAESLALLRKGPRPEQIRAAQARSRGSEAALENARIRRKFAVIDSPVSGSVMAKHAEPGEHLSPGAPVVTVGDLRNVWLRAYIPESDLGRVKQGTPAAITTDTYPGKQYQGKVTFISPEAEFTPRTVQTPKERVKLVYRIRISLNNPSLELKPGMPADAVIGAGARQ